LRRVSVRFAVVLADDSAAAFFRLCRPRSLLFRRQFRAIPNLPPADVLRAFFAIVRIVLNARFYVVQSILVLLPHGAKRTRSRRKFAVSVLPAVSCLTAHGFAVR